MRFVSNKKRKKHLLMIRGYESNVEPGEFRGSQRKAQNADGYEVES